MAVEPIVAAVDWDGTIAADIYPKLGSWLDGATEGLQRLDRLGRVVIHTCRVAPVAFGGEHEWRNPLDVAAEMAAMKQMLSEHNLGHLEIWTKPWKPPAKAYVDDRAIRFEGDWAATVAAVEAQVPQPVVRGRRRRQRA